MLNIFLKQVHLYHLLILGNLFHGSGSGYFCWSGSGLNKNIPIRIRTKVPGPKTLFKCVCPVFQIFAEAAGAALHPGGRHPQTALHFWVLHLYGRIHSVIQFRVRYNPFESQVQTFSESGKQPYSESGIRYNLIQSIAGHVTIVLLRDNEIELQWRAQIRKMELSQRI